MAHKNSKNFYERFAATAERFRAHTAVEFQHRDGVESVTYEELQSWSEGAASFLASRGIQAGDACALLADNSIPWCAAYLGILRIGALAVPLDTHYGPAQISALVRDSGAKILFTTSRYLTTVEEARRLSGFAGEIVLLHGQHPECRSLEESRNAQWPPLPSCAATRQDPAVILYTSGTTSDPKGVVLTHGNLLAEAEAVFQVLKMDERDSILGVMPLYHSLAQLANLLLPFLVGARVIYLEELGTSGLLRTLRERHPTAFCCVPQFFYLIHQRLLSKVAEGGWTRVTLFRSLLAASGALRRLTGLNCGPLLFRSVHQVLGGKMRLLVTGGARFDSSVGQDFYRLGFNLFEAYGLTESCGAATLTRPAEGGRGTVGTALPGVEVKIVPSSTAAGDGLPDGEIAIRGPIVMKEYFRRRDATAEVLEHGWLRTGDLGRLDEHGRLVITGRKKELIVLSSGKNIYPEEIEAHYTQSPYIKELCVLGLTPTGEPAAERLHAVIVPNLEVLRARKIFNMKEVLRFDIENLSIHLPAHKRILSYEIWTEDLPRTTTRKLKRFEIERKARNATKEAEESTAPPEGREEECSLWAADPGVARALELIGEAAHDKRAVRPEANLELDLGLDSIERVELLANLENLFGIRVPAEAAESAYTVRQLVDSVRSQPHAPGSRRATDAWSTLVADLPGDEPVFSDLLKQHRVFTLVAYATLKSWHLLAHVLLGFRVSGMEHFPRDRAFLICPNHQSYLDPFLLVSALPFRAFRRLFFVGASEYFATPLRRKAAKLMHVAPVDPDSNLLRAMQAGAFGLRHGKILILFPEGERSIDGEVKRFRKGAAILSLQLQAAVLPAAFEGAFDVWPRNRSLRWSAFLPWKGTRVRLRFGPLLPPVSPVRSASPAQNEEQYASFAEHLRQVVLELRSMIRKPSESLKH